MKRLLLAMLVITACSVSFAQQKPASTGGARTAPKGSATTAEQGTEDEAAKIADIRKLLQLTGSREMVNQMKGTLMEQFRQSSPNLPPEMFQEMLAEMKAEDLEESIIPIYVKHFSAADIKHLIAFYDSPFGRKVTRVMPQILQESNEVGMNWGQNVVTRVATKWRKEGKLTEREYEQLVGPEDRPH
jgi:uncharacterized protein